MIGSRHTVIGWGSLQCIRPLLLKCKYRWDLMHPPQGLQRKACHQCKMYSIGPFSYCSASFASHKWIICVCLLAFNYLAEVTYTGSIQAVSRTLSDTVNNSCNLVIRSCIRCISQTESKKGLVYLNKQQPNTWKCNFKNNVVKNMVGAYRYSVTTSFSDTF